MEEPRWTLDELAERVDDALAVDYHGQPSGRVRDVPDRRAIRWYTTIGLIDRPVAHRGRTALYGPRHLLQLVAVKRLQAKGLPLVAIQQELAGATDTELGRVARLPATAPAQPQAYAGSPVPKVAARSPSLAAPGTSPPVGPEAPGGLDLAPGPSAATAPAQSASRAAAATAPAAPAARRLAAGPARRAAFWREPPATATGLAAGDATAPRTAAGATTLRGVRLGDGATLLLEPGRDLDAADLQAILDAARPLLTVLRARRLGGVPDPTFSAPEPAAPAPGPPRRRAAGREPRREHP